MFVVPAFAGPENLTCKSKNTKLPYHYDGSYGRAMFVVPALADPKSLKY